MSRPPSTHPAAPPPAAAAVQIPTARCRSWPSGVITVSMAKAAGDNRAAAAPCAIRDTINSSGEDASRSRAKPP